MADEATSFPFGKCRICTGKAMGVHYGTATCEGCKAFFKRWMDRDKTLACFFGGNCVITPDTRHCCKGCRYRKCKENGMSIEAIKMGRIPKTEKRAAIQDASRNEFSTSCSSKNIRKEKDVVKGGNKGVVNKRNVSERNHSSPGNSDQIGQEENVPIDSPEKSDQSIRSSSEKRFFPGFEETFCDRPPSSEKSVSLSNGEDKCPSDHTKMEGLTSSHHQAQNLSFLHHQPDLANHTLSSAHFTSASGLAPVILNADELESDSSSTTSPKTSSGTIYLLMDEISKPKKNTPGRSASQNKIHQSECLTSPYTSIPPKVMRPADRPVDDGISAERTETLQLSTDQNCDTSFQDGFLNTTNDRHATDTVLSRTMIEGPKVCEATRETHEDLPSKVRTSQVPDVGRNSAHLYNYVRLLTDSSLSGNESPINGLECDFSCQNNVSFGTQSNDLWTMDNSPTVSLASVGCPASVTSVECPVTTDRQVVYIDSPSQHTLYLPGSMYSNVESGLDNREEVTGIGGRNDNKPEVQCKLGECVKNTPDVVQQNSSLTHESLQSDHQQDRNQNDKPRYNVQIKVLNQTRLSQLTSAIFRSLNGSMRSTYDDTGNFIRTHSSYGNDDQTGKKSDQNETNTSHMSQDTDHTDIRDVIRKTLKVFQRSVDKLYIPIFLKRRIAKKYQDGGKCVKIARTSKEGTGHLMSKLLSEIKTENERITGFALEIPGFSNLGTNDQMILLKRAFIEIHLLTSLQSEASDEYFYTEDNDLVLNHDVISKLVDARMVELVNTLYELMGRFDLSHLEISLLCAIQLTSLDGVAADDTGSIGALHSHYLDVFSYILYSSTRNNKARMVVEIFFNLIPILKDLSKNINHFLESVLLEQNAELLFRNLL